MSESKYRYKGKVFFVLPLILFISRLAINNSTLLAYVNINGFANQILLCIGIVCFLLKFCMYDIKSLTIFDILKMLILTIIFLIAFFLNQLTDLIFLLILLLSSYRIRLDSVIKTHFFVYLAFTCITIFLSLSGIIQNFSPDGIHYSMGNTYTTDFASGILFLCLDFIYLYRYAWKVRYSLFIILIALITYVISSSMTSSSLIVISSLGTLFLLDPTCRKVLSSKILGWTSICIFPILFISSLYIHTSDAFLNSSFMHKLNFLFNNRFFYGHEAIVKFGISTWGKGKEIVMNMNGGGWGTNQSIYNPSNPSGNYFYVDNGYLQLTLLYGWIIAILICFGFSYFMFIKRKEDSEDYPVLVLIIIVLAISGISEPRFYNILYSVILLGVGSKLIFHHKPINNLGRK